MNLVQHKFLSVYICDRYAVIISNYSGKPFNRHTHSISNGNNKGLILHFNNSSPKSCQHICNWLWRRLCNSKVPKMSVQSLTVLKIVSEKVALESVSS